MLLNQPPRPWIQRSLGDVYAVLCYVERHRGEVEAYLRAGERRAQEVRAQDRGRPGHERRPASAVEGAVGAENAGPRKGLFRLAADHNFNEGILPALAARVTGLDLVRLRDVGKARTPDPDVLAWAAEQDRVLLTHDVDTMPGHAYDRVRAGYHLAGVVVVPQRMPIGPAVADLELLLACSRPDELQGRVIPPTPVAPAGPKTATSRAVEKPAPGGDRRIGASR